MSSPQETYDAMATAGTAKIMMPWHKQMIQGFMAGAYVALGALFANLMEGKFTHYADDEFEVAPGEANLIGGAVFPIGLIAIFMTGANLYTGNCMYIVPPLLNGTVPRLRALAWLAISWLSNFAGAGFVACVPPAHTCCSTGHNAQPPPLPLPLGSWTLLLSPTSDCWPHAAGCWPLAASAAAAACT
jgi:formate transporter